MDNGFEKLIEKYGMPRGFKRTSWDNVHNEQCVWIYGTSSAAGHTEAFAYGPHFVDNAQIRQLRNQKGRKFYENANMLIVPDCHRIDSWGDLQMLARLLDMNSDWHEPGVRNITAEVRGTVFNNCGFWGVVNDLDPREKNEHREMSVVLKKDGDPIAEINLATLFAIAARKM